MIGSRNPEASQKSKYDAEYLLVNPRHTIDFDPSNLSELVENYQHDNDYGN
jgi:hypothetical protein